MNIFVTFFIACGQEVENRGGSSLLANGYRSDLLKVLVGSKKVSILYNSDWKLLVKTKVVLQVTYWYGSRVLSRFFVSVGHETTYSKAPIIRTEHWAVLAVHSMYCRTGISTGTYNRNFRVGREGWYLICIASA